MADKSYRQRIHAFLLALAGSNELLNFQASKISLKEVAAISLLFLGVSLCGVEVRAQDQWEKEGEGEIKEVQIEIVKDRQIVLPRASRNFEKVRPRPYEPIKPAITYEFKNYRFSTADYNPAIRPLKLKQEELSRMYGNYVSGGLGNYASFFFEASATTKRDKNKFLGAHLYTLNFGSGPIAGKNSAASNTQLQVFGKSTGSMITLSGDIGYENRGAYFYGYDPAVEVDRNRIRQSYDIYKVNLGIENTKSGDFNYSLKGGFSYLKDHYQASEGLTTLSFSSNYKINESSNFLVNADYFMINRSDSLVATSPRHLLRIKPSYQFKPFTNLLLTAGVHVAIQNDQYSGSKDFHAYPHVKAQYQLNSSIEVYGIVTGDIDKVDLHTLSSENLWINSRIQIYHTNRALEFRGGLSGKIGRNVAVGAGVSVASLNNFYYYLNVTDMYNPAGSNVGTAVTKFNIVYDNNTQRINPFAEISYAKAETFTVSLRGDYFKYSTDLLLEPLHRPNYRVSVNSRYNLYSKITVEAGFIVQGGMKAASPGDPLPQNNIIIALEPALDLNMKGRYFFSKQFSAFLQFNNILSNKYPLFLGYPVRGFQVLGGVSWSF